MNLLERNSDAYLVVIFSGAADSRKEYREQFPSAIVVDIDRDRPRDAEALLNQALDKFGKARSESKNWHKTKMVIVIDGFYVPSSWREFERSMNRFIMNGRSLGVLVIRSHHFVPHSFEIGRYARKVFCHAERNPTCIKNLHERFAISMMGVIEFEQKLHAYTQNHGVCVIEPRHPWTMTKWNPFPMSHQRHVDLENFLSDEDEESNPSQ
jgi:hypothetical protein